MLLQQITNGLMLGGTYALVAIGYSLIFGVLRLIHLAHGEVFMVGAYIGLETMLVLDVGPIAALLAAILGTAALGIVMELIAFRPIRRQGGSFLAPMVSSIGAGLILQEVFTKIFGSEQSEYPSQFGNNDVYNLGYVLVSATQLFIMATALVAMVALHLLVSRTRYGMAMRATAENIEIASILGINTDAVIMLTFAVASALAGVAGVLVGLAYTAVSPFMGINMAVKGLAIMLVGGLGSIYGAMAGGLLLGIVEVLCVAYLASSYRDAVAFGLMIVIMLVRPRGLFTTGIAAER
ncbi:MAG: branched-chain amino acid ABC transporter permease [Xanthobacteraceae bacterium]